MGIYCEINIHKPENGAFIGTAGNVVSGFIKYAVDEETVFNKITVSLKGMGYLHITERQKNKERTYSDREVYIDEDNVIPNSKEITIPIGTYEIPFRFVFPRNVPPTLAYRMHKMYNVVCNIKYYVRIKFSRPGFIQFAKRFKKEITVISGITPRLSTAPITYGGQKKLLQLLKRDPGVVNIKANILNSVLKANDKIVLIYEVTNNTNLVVNAVKTKLIEVYKFYVHERQITKHEAHIPETDSKTAAIQRGEIQEMSVEINIPSERESIEFSKLVSRDYYVVITVYLPIPHRNHVLEIPVQIGNNIITENNFEVTHNSFENEKPPSYWEAMNEYSSDKIDLNDET